MEFRQKEEGSEAESLTKSVSPTEQQKKNSRQERSTLMLLGTWLTKPVNSHGGTKAQGSGIVRSRPANMPEKPQTQTSGSLSNQLTYTPSQTLRELGRDAHCATLIVRYNHLK